MAHIKEPVEITKYIKIPDRRLISGFLSVNVIHHDDNDDYDDANQYYYDNWGSQPAEITTPIHPFAGNRPNDPGRNGMKHTFGDYDCLLFWVAGGMTLHPITFSNKMGISDLYNGGGANDRWISANSNSASWEDTGLGLGGLGFNEYWFHEDDVTHKCQNFIKSHLVSRINNGYGHVANFSNPTHLYHKIQGIYTNSYEYDDGTTSTEITQTSSMRSHDHIGVTASGNNPQSVTTPEANRDGNNNKYIVSNGVFSDHDDNTDDPIELGDATNNTFFPMVQNVHIYGKHKITLPSHVNGNGEYIYTNGNTSVGNYLHSEDHWNLVIKIQLRGYDSVTATGPTDADTEFFKTRANVSFHPFGETASFDVGNTLT